ncbi:unnamed protein product [Phytophthora fragariaefolia]|uniref:Unnamed protein product n=1 Tax=Phytophthora fragariaefolia TaxID=1490495 RepID=A0A9W6YLI3_9STRA|nr:unnamed protein product [Phytophthora fragariaefolia]
MSNAVMIVLESVSVAAAAVASFSARADAEFERTVTKLNFENYGLLNGYEHSFEKVALLLFYLASSGTIKEAGMALGMSMPSAVITINALLRVIYKQSSQFIKLPSSQTDWSTIMNGFALVKGFQYVYGAVDGSRFEIPRPAEYDGWYCKYGYPAINMQALCDFRRRFLDYDMRPGSYIVKKTWDESNLGMSVKTILPIGCDFLADAGYTLMSELLTPYIPREEGGQLSKCSGAAVACVRGRRRLTESEYESVRSLSTDS